MIIRLTGGLGNQMSQYAYGRAKSLKNNQKLYYYFIHYRGDAIRNYELKIFPIKGTKINGVVIDLLVKLGNLLHVRIPGIELGYWQGERYFNDYEKEIRNDFRFIKLLDKKNRDILNIINKTNSVSIHIRRGDYVFDKKTKEFHGLLPVEYYKKAIKIINKKIKNSKYFVFSDDPEWVKNNLKIDSAIYIYWNKGRKNYIDMQLMSNCKHNIIANSSFSWWGAWLNCNPNKIVVAPQKWFNNAKAQKESTDLIPKTWKKI